MTSVMEASGLGEPAYSPEQGTQPRAKRRRGLRSMCAGMCLVLAALLLPLGVIGFWGQRTLTDTERFVETVGPLAADATIQASIATTVTGAVIASVDVEGLVAQYLPPAAKPLSGPLSTAMDQFVYNTTLKILESPQFQQLWITITTRLQQAVIAALTGDSSGPVKLEGGQIVLDLGQLVQAVKQQLAAKIPAIANAPTPAAANTQVVLLDANGVEQAQLAYAFSVPIARWLIVIVLLLFAGAIVLSRRRWRMVSITGFCMVLGAAGIWLLLAIGEKAIGSTAAGTPFAAASTVFFTTLTSFLDRSIVILLIIGLIVMVTGWALTDQRQAARLRSKIRSRHTKPPGQPDTGTISPHP